MVLDGWWACLDRAGTGDATSVHFLDNVVHVMPTLTWSDVTNPPVRRPEARPPRGPTTRIHEMTAAQKTRAAAPAAGPRRTFSSRPTGWTPTPAPTTDV